MSLPRLNPIEPPWYGPVCPVVWEGWHCEVSPYPDQCALWKIAARNPILRIPLKDFAQREPKMATTKRSSWGRKSSSRLIKTGRGATKRVSVKSGMVKRRK
jgi:hypothetical protein